MYSGSGRTYYVAELSFRDTKCRLTLHHFQVNHCFKSWYFVDSVGLSNNLSDCILGHFVIVIRFG